MKKKKIVIEIAEVAFGFIAGKIADLIGGSVAVAIVTLQF